MNGEPNIIWNTQEQSPAFYVICKKHHFILLPLLCVNELYFRNDDDIAEKDCPLYIAFPYFRKPIEHLTW